MIVLHAVANGYGDAVVATATHTQCSPVNILDANFNGISDVLLPILVYFSQFFHICVVKRKRYQQNFVLASFVGQPGIAASTSMDTLQ